MNVQVETDVEKMKATVVNLNDIGNGNLCSDRDYENATDATHGSLALKEDVNVLERFKLI